METPLLQLQRMATWLMISPVPLGSVVIISSWSWTWTFRSWSLMYHNVRLTALHPTGVQRDTGIASSHSVHNNCVAVWSMWEEKGGPSTLLWWRFAQEDCGALIDSWSVYEDAFVHRTEIVLKKELYLRISDFNCVAFFVLLALNSYYNSNAFSF